MLSRIFYVVLLLFSVGESQDFSRFNFNLDRINRDNIDQGLDSYAYISSIDADYGSLSVFQQIVFKEIPRLCDFSPICKGLSQYYQPDGGCNNAFDSARGKAHRPFKRLIPADYGDNVGSMRKGSTLLPLPNARHISIVMSDVTSPPVSQVITQFVPFWGQFMVHDVASTPSSTRSSIYGGINCDCSSKDPECINIPIMKGDIQYKDGKNCLPVIRSQPVANEKCETHVREQVNEITAFLDASNVYGSSASDLNELLDPNSAIGELKIGDNELPSYFEPGPILPLTSQVSPSFKAKNACPFEVHKPQHIPCFIAGDIRSNENPALTSVHHLLLSYHNRIVRELKNINPHWNKQQFIQTARLIVSTMIQRITYSQFLPIILGPDWMDRFDLNLLEEGYSHGYDTSYDASVSNSFAAAAFRMGHTLVKGQITRDDGNWNPHGPTLDLEDNFFNSIPFETNDFGRGNSILRGISNDPAQQMDPIFSDDLQNNLFKPISGGLGSDLLAINIQRGRGHGIPAYNKFRELCGLKKASTFDDLLKFRTITESSCKNYTRIVDDVDLYIAGISETPVTGGTVGPTFACIIAYQFRDLKKGDRFWHENGGDQTVLTPDQLKALRNYGLPSLMCDMLENMNSIQPNPLLQHTLYQNERKDCKSYPRLALEVFREPNTPVDPVLSYIYTPWFPLCENECENEAYNRLLLSRSDDVCKNALGSQVKTLSNGQKIIRFQCLPGSIPGTDYPKITRNAVWSSWENTPKTLDGNDIEIKIRNTKHICVKPIAIQAQTIHGVPARKTGEIFEEMSPSNGFICKSEHQSHNYCSDYRVRYLCSSLRTTTPRKIYTDWVSVDNSNGDGGDFEFLKRIQDRDGFCTNPIDIEVRSRETLQPPTQTFHQISPEVGAICLDHENKFACENYEVRYVCVNKDIPHFEEIEFSDDFHIFNI